MVEKAYMVEKTVWNADNPWCFVGAQEDGSRRQAIEVIQRFLRKDSSENPIGLLIEGAWGIGKTSTIAYAMIHFPSSETPVAGPFTYHVSLYPKVSEVSIEEYNAKWELLKQYATTQELIDTLLLHQGQKRLLVIRGGSWKELEEWLQALHSKMVSEWHNLCFILEFSPYLETSLEEIKELLQWYPESGDKLTIEGLRDEDGGLESEWGWVITGCPSHQQCDDRETCKHGRPKPKDYSSNSDLLTEIHRWAGTHPYALRILRQAVATLPAFEEPQSTLNECYVRKALGREEHFKDKANELIRNIRDELGNEISFIMKGKIFETGLKKLREAGLLIGHRNEDGTTVIQLLHTEEVPPPPITQYPLEFEATLELVYWWWLIENEPDDIRVTSKEYIKECIEEIKIDRIRQWFGVCPMYNNQVDQRPETKSRLLSQAYSQKNNDLKQYEKQVMDTIKRHLRKLLREKFTVDDLRKLWQDFGYSTPQFDLLGDQVAISEKLVEASIAKGNLQRMITQMRERPL